MSAPHIAIWGHRGASAAWPENTLEGFKAAIRDGADGLESDVHISRDGIVLCCHDPHLDRTTTGRGLISRQDFHGDIDRLMTLKGPAQPIPTFEQTIKMLCEPEYSHAVLDVDVKVDNDPDRLFTLIHEIISAQPRYLEELAPRIILGLWHPVFIEPARRILPYCRLSFIGISLTLARDYFWDHCSGFSLRFAVLMGPEGQTFIADCKKAGKEIYVWTVNKRHEAIEAARWGVDVVLTDHTADMVRLRDDIALDWDAVQAEAKPLQSIFSIEYNPVITALRAAWSQFLLHRSPVGPLAPAPAATKA